MAYNPGVSWFVAFHDLDPTAQRQCIFFTQKGERCRWSCRESDNERAIDLYTRINAQAGESIGLDQLQEYILCNCCISGRARHQHRIEDIGLLTPLAQRWQGEIQSRPRPSAATESEAESHKTCHLHSVEAPAIASSVPSQNAPLSETVVSEFRTHVANPAPEDSLHQKILDNLKDRDFETGSLYIFDRSSSPGHVKIGWTAKSVLGRLGTWSKCGYTPNLLFQADRVPYAQRVETLTHHELIKEWRRERMCKASWCRKSHQEWFEVSQDRAAQVLGDWANFATQAKPYDSEGSLREEWRFVVNAMSSSEESITVKKLLEYHEASLAEQGKLTEESTDSGHATKLEDVRVALQVKRPPESEVSRNKIFQEPHLGAKDLCESQSIIKTEPLLKEQTFTAEALPESQDLSIMTPSSRLQKQPKTEKMNTQLRTESQSDVEPLDSDALQKTSEEKRDLSEQASLPSSAVSRSQNLSQENILSRESNPKLSVRRTETSAPSDRAGESMSETLRSGRRRNERLAHFQNQDESTLVETRSERKTTGGTGEETFVEEDLALRRLRKTASKIVDDLQSEISATQPSSVSKALGKQDVLKTEAPPAIMIAAQA